MGWDSFKDYMSALFGQLEYVFLAVASCLKLLAAAVTGQMSPCGMQDAADAESSQEGWARYYLVSLLHTHPLHSILLCWDQGLQTPLLRLSVASFPSAFAHWGCSVGDEVGGRERILA